MVKRILENKKYIGDKDYPVIIPPETAELALKCKDKKCAEISENDKIKLDMYRAKACCAICGAKMKRSHAGSGKRKRGYIGNVRTRNVTETDTCSEKKYWTICCWSC